MSSPTPRRRRWRSSPGEDSRHGGSPPPPWSSRRVVFEDRRLEKSAATLPRRRRAAVVPPRPGWTPQLPPPSDSAAARYLAGAPNLKSWPPRPRDRTAPHHHLRDRGRSPFLISSAATPAPLSSLVGSEPPQSSTWLDWVASALVALCSRRPTLATGDRPGFIVDRFPVLLVEVHIPSSSCALVPDNLTTCLSHLWSYDAVLICCELKSSIV
jgi:hypothetical protein